MAEKKRNLFDDGVFKPLAKIGQGKTMRLRLQLWLNCLQFGTKINDNFVNLNLSLDQFACVEDWLEDLEKDAEEKVQKFAVEQEGNYRMESVATRNN